MWKCKVEKCIFEAPRRIGLLTHIRVKHQMSQIAYEQMYGTIEGVDEPKQKSDIKEGGEMITEVKEQEAIDPKLYEQLKEQITRELEEQQKSKILETEDIKKELEKQIIQGIKEEDQKMINVVEASNKGVAILNWTPLPTNCLFYANYMNDDGTIGLFKQVVGIGQIELDDGETMISAMVLDTYGLLCPACFLPNFTRITEGEVHRSVPQTKTKKQKRQRKRLNPFSRKKKSSSQTFFSEKRSPAELNHELIQRLGKHLKEKQVERDFEEGEFVEEEE